MAEVKRKRGGPASLLFPISDLEISGPAQGQLPLRKSAPAVLFPHTEAATHVPLRLGAHAQGRSQGRKRNMEGEAGTLPASPSLLFSMSSLLRSEAAPFCLYCSHLAATLHVPMFWIARRKVRDQ